MSVQVRAVESRSARKILISATELAKKKKKKIKWAIECITYARYNVLYDAHVRRCVYTYANSREELYDVTRTHDEWRNVRKTKNDIYIYISRYIYINDMYIYIYIYIT